MFLDGKADIWFQSFKLVQECISWSEFCDVITKRFGKKGGLDEQEEFNKLAQTASVLDYVEKFKEMKYVLLCRNPHLDEKYFISSFVSGLKLELKPKVRLMKPSTLLDAIEIAQYQEQAVEIMMKKQEVKKSVVSINTKWSANDKKGETSVIAEKKEGGVKDNFKKISPEEFQYRRNNHLCYKCWKKFSQGHQCKNHQYTFMLMEDGEYNLLDEVLEEEEEEGTVAEVSLNALSEKLSRITINLEGLLFGSKVNMLIDSVSTLSFIDSKLVEETKFERSVVRQS